MLGSSSEYSGPSRTRDPNSSLRRLGCLDSDQHHEGDGILKQCRAVLQEGRTNYHESVEMESFYFPAEVRFPIHDWDHISLPGT